MRPGAHLVAQPAVALYPFLLSGCPLSAPGRVPRARVTRYRCIVRAYSLLPCVFLRVFSGRGGGGVFEASRAAGARSRALRARARAARSLCRVSRRVETLSVPALVSMVYL